MIHKLKIITLFCLPFWMLFSYWSNTNNGINETIEIYHEVEVKHPGEKELVATILTEIKTKDSITIGYTMDVVSVICLEEVCKVIPVTIYWDEVGKYQKYKVAKGETLEKYEADLFEPQDYVKLNSVLANENSPFKDVLITEVLSVVEHGDVDAVSGATALQLDEKDTVPGAALTCYTLWHWANGSIIEIIKNKTGESASNQQLLSFIESNDEIYYQVALNELAKRGTYSPEFVEIIIQKASDNPNLIKTCIQYLEKVPQEVYETALKSIFIKSDKRQRIAVLRSLQYSKHNITTEYLDSFGEEIHHLKSFQEFSVFLSVMEEKNPNSEIINSALIPLLQADFLIARRVYWYLQNQKNLSETEQHQLDGFIKKYSDKL
ncbi:hypothetical protein [Seonamhaeicola marinus]|uniref:Uncharacterized protein n=1 Tax=Seonamhaeicola marinus TaxID=1912246 RepID=A0A5D0J7F3_9FLAO|nr:hypothetical protein [Seonamhaeicola marinus]TYA92113.1 hypothetical protein FUA24_01385 [Seonamhaeicola marinus]